MQPLRRLIEWFVPRRVAEGAQGPRALMAVGIALLMAVVFVVLAATHAVTTSFREAVANLTLALGMLVGPLVLRLTGQYPAVINGTLGFALAAITFLIGAERGAGINAATVAMAEVPLFATLLAGPRTGACWAALACAASAALGYAQYAGLLRAHVPGEAGLFNDHAVLVVVTLTLYLVATLYEHGRARGLAHIAALEAERRQTELDKLEAQAEARLVQSERMASLGRIAAAAAHEINNPLSYVANNLEYALEGLRVAAGSEPVIALGEALGGVRRIQRIVADLRVYSRPTLGAPAQVDVRRALEAALKMAEGHVRESTRLELDLAESPPVLGDESRLTQVFLNLLVNAAQAIPEGRPAGNRIAVRVRADGGRVLVEVEDTGVGMTGDQARRLGEAFFTTKAEGMGLGLAVCQSILAQIGGELSFESRPGRTVARVRLAPAPPPPPVTETLAPTPLATRRPPPASRHVRAAAPLVAVAPVAAPVAVAVAPVAPAPHATVGAPPSPPSDDAPPSPPSDDAPSPPSADDAPARSRAPSRGDLAVSSLGPGGGPDSPEPAGDDAALPGPASGDGPPSPVPASGDARAPRAAQVLIIDDEAMVARAIQRCLREHDVRIAPGGREALALLDAGETFDLVLCDLMMPELSGMDVYDAIRDRHPALLDRVVFMTGGTFTDRAQEFRASITNPFLEKPLQTDKLLDLVERRVGAWGGSRVA